MNKKEIRTMEEIKAVDDEKMVVEGFALKFNTESNDLGGFVETISPEALENADLSDVRCLINHDYNQVLGRTTSETLVLEIREEGLYFKAQLPNTTYAKDLYENIRLGNISQCSFGFILDEDGDEFEKREDGLFKRTLRKIKSLFDVSIVTYPAYQDTNVEPALRSIEQIKQEEIEAIKAKEHQEEIRKQTELIAIELDLLKLK